MTSASRGERCCSKGLEGSVEEKIKKKKSKKSATDARMPRGRRHPLSYM